VIVDNSTGGPCNAACGCLFRSGGIVKTQLVYAAVIIILGLLIALGPQFLFKVCNAAEENFPRCHWSARAEIGTGIIIAGLGICMLLFPGEPKIRLGLSAGVFFTGITALLIPHTLIGGCSMMSMRCWRVAFPSLSVISVVLLLIAMADIIYGGLVQAGCLPDRSPGKCGFPEV
jgi:hypothetical protein